MNVVVSEEFVFVAELPTTVDIGLVVVEFDVVLWFTVVVVVCELGRAWLEIVVATSFSGQNKIMRIAIMSKMIAMVGQWALVNDQNEDACAVCGC